MVLTAVFLRTRKCGMKAKDAILHIRIESKLRERASKKAARSKKNLTQYVCDLIDADTRAIKDPRRESCRSQGRLLPSARPLLAITPRYEKRPGGAMPGRSQQQQYVMQISERRIAMIATDRKVPETLGELAASLAELAGHLDEVTKGLSEYPFTVQTNVLVDRMEQAGVDGPCAAFHGFTYAWILAKQPELINEGDAVLGQILWIEDENYRTHVVLRSRVLGDYNKVSLLLPRIFDHVDRNWADRNEPEDGE
jgi:hypothetical protein